MDEVSSSGPLDCPRSRASPIKRLFHLFFESHTGRAAVPIPKRSASPRVISTPQWWIGLKALDQNRPIREGTRPTIQNGHERTEKHSTSPLVHSPARIFHRTLRREEPFRWLRSATPPAKER